MKRSIALTVSTITLATVAALAGSAAFATSTKNNVRNPQIVKHEAGNDCFFFSTIRDFRPLDQTHMVVWAPSSKTPYLVTLTFPIFDLTSAWRVAFVDGNRDGNVCSFGRDQVVVPDGLTTERASIRGVSRLDDAAIAAVEQQYEVKITPKKKSEKTEGAQ